MKKESKDIDIVVAPSTMQYLMKSYQGKLAALKRSLTSKGFVLEYEQPKEQTLNAGTCLGSMIYQQVIKVVDFASGAVLEVIDFDFRELDSNYKHPVDDLKTRDFTVNGLYYDINQRTVRDFIKGENFEYNQGIADINSKILRCINPFALTFTDVSRYVRAVRFQVTKGFTMEPELKAHFDSKAVKTVWSTSMKDLWSVIKEIGKILKSDKYFVDGMACIGKSGLIMGQPRQSDKNVSDSRYCVNQILNCIKTFWMASNLAGSMINQISDTR